MGTEGDPAKIAAEAAAAASSALAKQSYEDLAQPAARELGLVLKTGASVIRLVMRPLATLVDAAHASWDRLDHRLRQRLLKEPPEKVVEPPPYVAGPLLLGYPFVEEQEELRALFEELLAKSMLIDSKPLVHPAFVDILKQISPDEARLLPVLATANRHACLRVAYTHEAPPPPLPQNTAPPGARPTVTPEEAFQAVERHRARRWIGSVMITALGDRAHLEQPGMEAVERALNNLERLALIHPQQATLTNKQLYDPVIKSAAMKEMEEWATSKTFYIEPTESAIEMTAFGRQLLELCLPPGATTW